MHLFLVINIPGFVYEDKMYKDTYNKPIVQPVTFSRISMLLFHAKTSRISTLPLSTVITTYTLWNRYRYVQDGKRQTVSVFLSRCNMIWSIHHAHNNIYHTYCLENLTIWLYFYLLLMLGNSIFYKNYS